MPLTTIQGTSLTLNPKTKEQLRALIDYLVGLEGVSCDLNHIDISGVDDFTELFYRSPFMGDISGWNVSHVRCMRGMFEQSKFTTQFQPLGLSRWDVSGVTDMSRMFNRSAFDGDLSQWKFPALRSASNMFAYASFNGDIADWDVSQLQNMQGMFRYSVFKGDLSRWCVANATDLWDMFQGAAFVGNIQRWCWPLHRGLGASPQPLPLALGRGRGATRCARPRAPHLLGQAPAHGHGIGRVPARGGPLAAHRVATTNPANTDAPSTA